MPRPKPARENRKMGVVEPKATMISEEDAMAEPRRKMGPVLSFALIFKAWEKIRVLKRPKVKRTAPISKGCIPNEVPKAGKKAEIMPRVKPTKNADIKGARKEA